MPAIRLEKLSKIFPGGHVGVKELDLTIAEEELMILVGPSGCGKSTTLRLIAGLEAPTAGRIYVGEEDVTDLAPQERDLAMVFQTYALYPHRTVSENLGFALRMRKTPKDEIEQRVAEAARILGLEGMLGRRPAQLSGGQRQRVALGRAIVREPQAFLLDEPLSNLDARLRAETRTELARLHRRLAATMVFVTHDQEEAMTLGTRIAVLRDGSLQQVGEPQEVYDQPANVFVAGFIGSPAMNLWEGELVEEDDNLRVRTPGFRFTVAAERRAAMARDAGGGDVIVGVRPADLQLSGDREGFPGRVDVIEPLGGSRLLHVRLEGGEEAVVQVPDSTKVAEGARVTVRLPEQRYHLFDRPSGCRLS
ncbi:MAG: sn-glycerol-3-phosphate ABC transporter ATP-binding protein UgpC [Candidatus Eisenbacteria bacterium]|nr:sn-glycerol-3-phosphate ABC transporter ATP-binding protein UgpC [Candidatus Eisenbacteria bacterium]